MQEYFRDVYDHLHRINAAIEGMREMLHDRDLGVNLAHDHRSPRAR